MACVRHRRRAWHEIPDALTRVSSSHFYDVFRRVHSYVLSVHNVHISELELRVILTDALYDSLRPKDHTRFRCIVEEYHHLHSEVPTTRILEDWHSFRSSEHYKRLMSYAHDLPHSRHRFSVATDIAMSYILRHQNRLSGTFLDVERALKLDYIEKIWSKKAVWILATLLFFEVEGYLEARSFDDYELAYELRRQVYEHDRPIVPRRMWYERRDVPEWLNLAGHAYSFMVTALGEIGSVLLADVARRYTVSVLFYLSRIASTLAMFHPALRALSLASRVTHAAGVILENSVLAWLGWQIGVEWEIDGAIQMFLHDLGRLVASLVTGKNFFATEYSRYVNVSSVFAAMRYLMYKYSTGISDPIGEQLLALIRESPKQFDIISRFQSVLDAYARVRLIDYKWNTLFRDVTTAAYLWHRFYDTSTNAVEYASSLFGTLPDARIRDITSNNDLQLFVSTASMLSAKHPEYATSIASIISSIPRSRAPHITRRSDTVSYYPGHEKSEYEYSVSRRDSVETYASSFNSVSESYTYQSVVTAPYVVAGVWYRDGDENVYLPLPFPVYTSSLNHYYEAYSGVFAHGVSKDTDLHLYVSSDFLSFYSSTIVSYVSSDSLLSVFNVRTVTELYDVIRSVSSRVVPISDTPVAFISVDRLPYRVLHVPDFRDLVEHLRTRVQRRCVSVVRASRRRKRAIVDSLFGGTEYRVESSLIDSSSAVLNASSSSAFPIFCDSLVSAHHILYSYVSKGFFVMNSLYNANYRFYYSYAHGRYVPDNPASWYEKYQETGNDYATEYFIRAYRSFDNLGECIVIEYVRNRYAYTRKRYYYTRQHVENHHWVVDDAVDTPDSSYEHDLGRLHRIRIAMPRKRFVSMPRVNARRKRSKVICNISISA